MTALELAQHTLSICGDWETRDPRWHVACAHIAEAVIREAEERGYPQDVRYVRHPEHPGTWIKVGGGTQ